MTDKQIKLDGSWIPIEEAIKLGLISKNDIKKEQIVIDGVDVSGCELYRDDNGVFAPDGTAERTELCYLTNDYCGNNPNCYYKQLKRDEQRIVELNKTTQAKEQECEELKKELHKNFEEKDTLHLIIDRLLEASGYDTNTASAEDFEDVYEHMRYEQQQLDQLKAENKELKKDVIEALKLVEITSTHNTFQESRINKLSKTLTEIKEIAENAYCLTNATNKDMAQFAKQILQKISEVEDAK